MAHDHPERSSEPHPHHDAPTGPTPGRGRPALPPPKDALRILCRLIIGLLRERCPDLFPKGESEPVETGEPGPEVPLAAKSVESLVRTAAQSAGGGETLLWEEGDDQLLVYASRVSTRVEDGLIVVRIPVNCEETGAADVQVAFAVGSEQRPAGLLATTESRPAGPPEVVEVWGEALTAFAWQAVMRMAVGVAAESGHDPDGTPLVPLGFIARPDELRLGTLARHAFDRVGA